MPDSRNGFPALPTEHAPHLISPEQKELDFEHELDELQGRIGYRFKNKALLVQAMTSPGFAHLYRPHSASNEALEHLGDTALGERAERYTRRVKKLADRESLEGALNSNAYLAIVGRRLQLDACVRVSKREVHAETVSGGGRQRNDREMVQIRLTSNALEALIGAIEADGGPSASEKFLDRFILPQPEASQQIKSIVNLFAGGVEDMHRALGELTSGRATLETRQAPDGRFGSTLMYAGEPILFVFGKSELDSVANVTHQFFFTRPWAFWGYEGPMSHVMPRASDVPYGAPPVSQVEVEEAPKRNRRGRIIWQLVKKAVRPIKEVISNRVRTADSWDEVELPPIQDRSSVSTGSYIDQLRLTLGEGNFIVTSPNPKAKHPRYSFHFNGAQLLTVVESKSLNDAARQALDSLHHAKARRVRRNGS